MRRRFWLLCLSVCLGVTSAGAALAEPPVGAVTIAFGPDERVYRIPKSLIGELPVGASCGKLKGGVSGVLRSNCRIVIRDGGIRGELEGPLRVVLDTRIGANRATVKLDMDGEVSAGGDRADASATAKAKATIPDGAGSLFLDFDVKVCLEDGGRKLCESESGVLDLDLDPGGGLWSLDMTIAEKRSGKLTGSAMARVGSKDVPYDVSGKYDEASGRAKIKLKPSKGKASDSSIKIVDVVVAGGTLTGMAKYDVYGQTGSKVPVSVAITP